MSKEEDRLVFDVRPDSGSVFSVDGTRVVDTGNPGPGRLVVNAANASGKWIDLVVESTYPTAERVWTTGRMVDGQSSSLQTDLRFYISRAIKITRWAPGFLGIPGNGGGEVFFEMPDSGDITVNITVTG